jgi:outer membrane protein assembly factor BamB
VGETVFLGSCNGVFRALDRRTGQVRWATKVGPDSEKYFFHGDPLASADLVVVGADGAQAGNVHAFDRSTGRQRWTYAAGRGVMGAIAAVGRKAYAIGSDGRLLSLDLDKGGLRWTFPLKGSTWESPAVAGSRVYAGSNDGTLYALNADTGRVEWQTPLGARVTTTVGVATPDLYVGTADGTMHRVDMRAGGVLSSNKVHASLKPGGSPVRIGDSLLVLLADEGADYRELVSLDLSLERVRWRQAPSKSWSTARRFFPWRQMVVVGTASGDVVGYCAADGTKAWSQTLGGTIRAIGGAEDTLYVGTVEGSLHAVRPAASCDTK